MPVRLFGGTRRRSDLQGGPVRISTCISLFAVSGDEILNSLDALTDRAVNN